ncbi:plasmid recombination protein [Roseivivax sediminis]|uniref:Plasmid recombination enzyme n=1 Tax=Roseivivax sediminis TaxID=936889 RepID=A0A1I2DYB1_9RHOB|nr:plasmid recombination protein [Roseivivax sediminis]SFE85634.1 hypothetical protein SAMN04515678_11937 [Roseivivax sediminis]
MSTSQHPIVLRFEGLRPEQLSRFELHRLRKHQDRCEVDRSRTRLNKLLIGSETWAREALTEIDEMRMESFANELTKLKKRKRVGEIEKRMIEGPKDPWRPSKHGPMREVIITAHAEWFEAAGDQATWRGKMAKRRREKEFEDLAIGWLTYNFGEDVVHARADRDEKTYHIHAVIMPRGEDQHGRPMLIPSKHEAIQSYELAQDIAGVWFAQAGLLRGEARAFAARQAKAAGMKGPDPVQHKPTWKWRQEVAASIWADHVGLNARSSALDTREKALGEAKEALDVESAAAETRSVAVGARETAAQHMADEADSVLAAAEGLAEDFFELTDDSSTPRLAVTEAGKASEAAKPLIRRLAKSKNGRRRAEGIFGRAWSAMRARAQGDAEERLREEFAEIETTRETLMAVVQHLPPAVRQRAGETWKAVVKQVVGLERLLRKRGHLGAEEDRRGDADPNAKASNEK